MANEVLGSLNVTPEVLDKSGFEFRDQDVDDVLATALAKD
jgi:NAD dependent epimerase/dehydratase family enzyme